MNKDLANFYSLIQEYQTILRTKKRKEILSHKLLSEEKRLESLLQLTNNEHNDILELESKPIVALFSKILKNEIKQLEKERQDYLLAVLEYKECKKVIALFKFELNLLDKKIANEEFVRLELNKVTVGLQKASNSKDKLVIKQLSKTIQELNILTKLKIETKELIDISDEIIEAFKKMLDLLNKAKEQDYWGASYAEIQKIKKLKKGHLDQAHSHVSLIKKLLIFLRSELNDITDIQPHINLQPPYLIGFNISYYANLVNDWISDSDLSTTLTNTMHTHLNMVKLNRDIKGLFEKTDQKVSILEERRLTMIENITLG